jgi:hypothetical protein
MVAVREGVAVWVRVVVGVESDCVAVGVTLGVLLACPGKGVTVGTGVFRAISSVA